ncbi:Sensor histidine kinase ResE [Streptococcus sp. DD12]|nr:Sensor histidine kinase ResE [Streptococcus sp. DD12]
MQPLSVIFLAFLGIFLAFNLAIRYFMAEQTEQALADQFSRFDALYQGQTTANQQTTQTIFTTLYVIADSQGKVQYASGNDDAFSDDTLSDDLTDQLYEDSHQWNDLPEVPDSPDDLPEGNVFEPPKARTISRNGENYAVAVRSYQGKLMGNYIAASDNDSQTYYVFVYFSVAPITSLTKAINTYLALLMLAIGTLAALRIFLTSRKLNASFQSLKTYIIQVGKRQKTENTSHLAYREFTEVRESIEQMDHMIAQNQTSQQIFFQNASHELRTPLMSIQGYAEGISEGVLSDTQAAAQVILDESQKMKLLVDDILTLSRLETIQTALNKESLDLVDLIYDVTWQLQQQAQDKGVRFHHDFAQAHVDIRADESLLSRALTNILTNAVRYAKTGIWLKTKVQDDRLLLAISNDGPSIPDQDLPHLFERFYKGQEGNFGIGLAMARDIIRQHGGDVSVISTAQETVFTIELPVN